MSLFEYTVHHQDGAMSLVVAVCFSTRNLCSTPAASYLANVRKILERIS